ncbi:unnamed protein product [Boreogadus saida]
MDLSSVSDEKKKKKESESESTQATGLSPANIKWLKTNETYGLFKRASRYKNKRGVMAERKVLKEKM